MKLFTSLLTIFLGVQSPMKTYAETTNFVVIDVRTAEEFADGFVKGSLNYDFYDPAFKDTIAKLDKSKVYKLYCRSGNRSGQAERMMKSLGFKEVENIGSVAEAAKILNKPIVKN